MSDDVPRHIIEAAKEYRAKRPKQAKVSKRFKLPANELNIGLALRNEIELHAGNLFRLDTFSGQTLVMHLIPVKGLAPPKRWQPQPITDVDVTHLMMWLQANNFQKVNAASVNRAIEVEAHRNQFSATRDALLALPTWDGKVRLEHFWIEACGTPVLEDGKDGAQRLRYLHATARCFFISIVARIMKPGCKVDTMVVLEGLQGDMKSSLLRAIAFCRDEWLSDSMTPDLASKDAKAHLAGKLIVELAEMQQMRGTGVETIKRFLSAQDDKYRPSYGRHEIVQPRQCVFVGTTNSNDYLKDITGNRRFWPIACGQINLEWARQIMPQLYAEALAAYNSGEKWWLPPEIEVIAEIEQDSRLTNDPWEDGVATVVWSARATARRNGETFFWVTSVSGLEAVEADKSRWDYQKQYRVALILKKLGGKNMRLPRDGKPLQRGFRFITGANGAGEASHQSHRVTPKPLN